MIIILTWIIGLVSQPNDSLATLLFFSGVTISFGGDSATNGSEFIIDYNT